MRMLVTSEIAEVSGGLPPCPPCPDDCPPGDEVVIPGRRPRRGPDATTGVGSPIVIDSGSINFHLFVLAIHEASGNYHLAWANKPGAIEVSQEDGLGDTVIGYPVDHHSALGLTEYQQAWQQVLSKMSVTELKAFSAALVEAAVDAKAMQQGGASDRLAQLASAVINGDSIGAAFASYQASEKLSQTALGLFEGFVTKAYATAAALPGGI